MKKKYDIEHDGDGWWVYYRPGWKSGNDPIGVQHSDHDRTRREAMLSVKCAIRCECKDCVVRT